MSGPIALHGGGEFQAGDEPSLQRLLELAAGRPGRSASDPVRVAIVPTAAARGRPALVGSHGIDAFERVAATMAWPSGGGAVEVNVIGILDATSAADAALAASLAAADLIHLPGGDPDLIPTVMAGATAWEAILTAHRAGAVLAGASAGAMALAPWTWTPGGGVSGLGLVDGLVVVPHASTHGWAGAVERFRNGIPPALGLLGVAERTAAISRPGEGGTWDVVGEGEVRWLAPGAELGTTVIVPPGGSLQLPR